MIDVSSPGCVEAAAITGRRAIASLQLRELVGIGRRRRHVELEVAGDDDARRAESREARGVGGGLRQAQIEAAEQRADRARQMPPALERALRHAAVDQDQRHAALGARHDQVRPQIGFDEQRQVGLPVVEEARDEARRVERHELMDDARRQPLLGQFAPR